MGEWVRVQAVLGLRRVMLHKARHTVSASTTANGRAGCPQPGGWIVRVLGPTVVNLRRQGFVTMIGSFCAPRHRKAHQPLTWQPGGDAASPGPHTGPQTTFQCSCSVASCRLAPVIHNFASARHSRREKPERNQSLPIHTPNRRTRLAKKKGWHT